MGQNSAGSSPGYPPGHSTRAVTLFDGHVAVTIPGGPPDIPRICGACHPPDVEQWVMKPAAVDENPPRSPPEPKPPVTFAGDELFRIVPEELKCPTKPPAKASVAPVTEEVTVPDDAQSVTLLAPAMCPVNAPKEVPPLTCAPATSRLAIIAFPPTAENNPR